MTAVAYTYRMPAGIAGEVSRFNVLGTTITPEQQNTTTPVTAYGVPVVVNANGVRPIAATDTTDVTVGFSVRPFPTGDIGVAFTMGTVPYGPGTPPTNGILNVLRRGFINVKLGGSAAAVKGGGVFVWYAASTGSHVQGQVEAATTAGSTFQITNASFMGAADSNGVTEIAYHV
jgi:hypothetical protein